MIVEKSVTNGVLYTNGAIMIRNVRASYPHLDKPYRGRDAKEDDPGKYRLVAMLPKESHGEVKDLIVQAINKLLAERAPDVKIPSDKKFIRNGDDMENVSYDGMYIVSASEALRPPVRNRKGELILDIGEIGNLIYGGCWINVLIRPWYQNNQFGKRVNASLLGVQFVKDDKPFGEGRIDSSAAWGAVDDGDEPFETNQDADEL
jgi:hypothetical protein